MTKAIRKKVSNNFKKVFHLMNKNKCGKNMENLRNVLDIRPITIAKDYQKLVNIPRFPFQKIFNKNLVTVHKTKEVLAIDEPAYVGRCKIDLSKTSDFHYNYIKDR